jgi:internalin A
LPENFGGLTNLARLDLRGNHLGELPDTFGNLCSLVLLWLWDNHLRTLPDKVGGLTSLRELYLEDNNLTDPPRTLLELGELSRLFLHGNEALQLPREILGPTRDEVGGGATPASPRAILDYYFATRGADGVALREMKLIVVGWGKAGKTTLVKRLAGERMDPNEPETHGIMIRPLTLHCTDGELRARVWDFGGQHVLHAMHEFFLTTRSLYLLVLEQRSDRAETDAKYWLQLIRSYASKAPVVVALNKSCGWNVRSTATHWKRCMAPSWHGYPRSACRRRIVRVRRQQS